MEKKLFSFHLRITTCFYEIVKYQCFGIPRSSIAEAFGVPGCQIPSWCRVWPTDPKCWYLMTWEWDSTINYLFLGLSVAPLNYLLKGILSTARFKPADSVITSEVWTLCYQHQYARAVCHFALIVSLRPGHNVSIKITSIEKSFLVFTSELQHAFMRSAVFHVEWPVLMQTQSLGIQTGSSSLKGKSGERVSKGGRERDGGRKEKIEGGALIEKLWLAVFSGAPGPPSCSNRVVASLGAVKEKSVL